MNFFCKKTVRMFPQGSFLTVYNNFKNILINVFKDIIFVL